MKEVSTDRRYQRTHEAIIRNAIELALANGWKKVSITALAQKTNINRNSFYLHFETMEHVFDEIEERFLEKYQAMLTSAPDLNTMIKDHDYFSRFSAFLKDEEEYVATISAMGRADQLLSKMSKIWLRLFDEELSRSPTLRAQKDIVLPYAAGCTMLFFTNWVAAPSEFDIRKNALFSGKFIEHALALASDEC